MTDFIPAPFNPIVTVLLSVHNGAAYLTEAVSSILNQTFSGFELLIIDDGSTDNSREIIDAFSDDRIRLISLPQNMGLVHALNEGLALARGKYIARMDADDVAEPKRLEQQVAYMHGHPDTVLLGTSFTYIDGHGHCFREHLLETCNETLQTELMEINQFCHPSVMMLRETVLRLGGYRDIAGRYAQDYDFWLRLAEHGQIANLDETLLRYRVHEEQISVSKLSKQRAAAELYKLLAKQRREGTGENISKALKSPSLHSNHIRQMVAGDYLSWASLYKSMGRHGRARSMLLKAARYAPMYSPVRAALLREVSSSLIPSSTKNTIRWYSHRINQIIFRR